MIVNAVITTSNRRNDNQAKSGGVSRRLGGDTFGSDWMLAVLGQPHNHHVGLPHTKQRHKDTV